MPIQNEELTAAECAARTGLTVRALRVYEEYGLIAPRRSEGGWRYYDAADLVRLNTIGLLKTAGLSLAQIRQVTILSERVPPLQHVLEMQLDTWKERRAWAERGQAVAESALRNLKSNDSLSIDELCNLVRNLEMSEQATDPSVAAANRPAAAVPEEILERYVGTYLFGEYSLLTVACHEGALVAQMAGWPPGMLTAESNTEFRSSLSQMRYTFQTNTDHVVTGVNLQSGGGEITASRIDAAMAADIKTRLAARIAGNTPAPGSDAALRRLIESLMNGTPNYDEMAAGFATTLRKQLTQMQMIARYLGAILSIEFKGVGKQGWDSYEVRRENGTALWRIAFVDGKITGAQASFADGP
jgi:DNA-binding transcriptional MerR regulator